MTSEYTSHACSSLHCGILGGTSVDMSLGGLSLVLFLPDVDYRYGDGGEDVVVGLRDEHSSLNRPGFGYV